MLILFLKYYVMTTLFLLLFPLFSPFHCVMYCVILGLHWAVLCHLGFVASWAKLVFSSIAQ